MGLWYFKVVKFLGKQTFNHRMVKPRGNSSTINDGNLRASESPWCDLEGETISQPLRVPCGTALSPVPVSKEVAADMEDTAKTTMRRSEQNKLEGISTGCRKT